MTTRHRPLTADDLRAGEALHRLRGEILLFDSVTSTNAELLTRAAELQDGSRASAEFQSAGRGRLGRRWVAPRGAAVLLSFLLHEPNDSLLLSLAGLLGAVAACDALETTTDVTPAVRWPNDITVEGRKLGGVLAETCAVGGGRALVLGIGLNCLQQRAHFPEELRARATSLEIEGTRHVDRPAVARALVSHLDTWLLRWSEPDGATALRRAWQARCAELGTRVTLAHDGRTFEGTAVEVSETGDLVVQLDRGGRRHFDAATTTRNG